MHGRSLRNRSFRPYVQAQAVNDIMQKVRKMARALNIAQRNMHESRLLLDSDKPFVNHSLEFTFQDIRHALTRDGAATQPGPPCGLKSLRHFSLHRSPFWLNLRL